MGYLTPFLVTARIDKERCETAAVKYIRMRCFLPDPSLLVNPSYAAKGDGPLEGPVRIAHLDGRINRRDCVRGRFPVLPFREAKIGPGAFVFRHAFLSLKFKAMQRAGQSR
jgi:hypothetical protein